jgi:hypothetical protein
LQLSFGSGTAGSDKCTANLGFWNDLPATVADLVTAKDNVVTVADVDTKIATSRASIDQELAKKATITALNTKADTSTMQPP